jgi:hypothetical protein
MNRLTSRRNAWLLFATVATLVLSIAFDLTAFATFVFPALWITTLGRPQCAPLAARTHRDMP